MNDRNLRKELAALERMTPAELREKYREMFGDESRSGNRQWLYRRCAWRLQELVHGGISERARRRAMEIANDADVRSIPPKSITPAPDAPRQTRRTSIRPDDRLPMARTVMTRLFKGRTYTVTVLPDGFEYDGEMYKSLTAVAHAITGSHWNGYHFFRKALVHAEQHQENG